MDLTSYLLGKNASSGGGGGDLSEYFNTEITSNTQSGEMISYDIVKKTPPFTVGENVTRLSYCFSNCTLKNLDVSQMNTSNVTRMDHMFMNCSYLEIADVSNFNVSKVTDFNGIFQNCEHLKRLDLSKWENNLDSDRRNMFAGCSRLAVLDVSSFSNFANYAFTNVGMYCLQSDGAYADGIPYVYVKNATVQAALTSGSYSAPNTWTTANVIIKS